MNKKRLDQLLARMTDDGELAMASLLVTSCVTHGVARDGGDIYRGVFGFSDPAKREPLADNAIFRVFSLTKVITAVSILQLIEQGLVALDDPAGDYLPGFRNQTVAFTDRTGRLDFRPAAAPNTVRTLLTMTSGIPYYHEGRGYAEDRMAKLYETINASPRMTTFEAANLIGQNPLAFDPGCGYYYGLGMEAVAAIVEVIAEKRFGEYCREHIFEPLGMEDTGFFVPREKLSRLCGLYRKDHNGIFQTSLTEKDSRQLASPAFEEGGDGIVTTTRDYDRFVQMLAHGGALSGRRILSKASVLRMSQNHLRGSVLRHGEAAIGRMEGPGYGYGFGVRILIDPSAAAVLSGKGQWGWLGKGGSWFCIDPEHDLTIVWNTQDTSEQAAQKRNRVINAVYGALE